MTRILTRRLKELEARLVPSRERPRLWTVDSSDRKFPLDADRCIEILGECGFLPTGVRFGIVNRMNIPDGLNAKELEKFLRERGAETRDFQRRQHYDGPLHLGHRDESDQQTARQA